MFADEKNASTMKKSPLYTRTGDAGATSLVGGTRTSKDSPRIEAYGTIDELNSHLGVIAAQPTLPEEERALLTQVQTRLFDIGGYLACDPDSEFTLQAGVGQSDINLLEHAIDRLDASLPKMQSFVLPGGSMASAQTHVARTVARRAERRIVALANADTRSQIDPFVLRYINRLSDYLFALARFNNINQNVPEIFWQKNCQVR